MTDTGPPTDVEDILVTGQRRADPFDLFPMRIGMIADTGVPGGEFPKLNNDENDGGDGMPEIRDPCANPATALEWNADAAAKTTKDLKALARTTHPGEQDFNEREYGAALWERANGSVVRGPMTAGQQTFYEASMAAAQGQPSRAGVAIDWTPPFADAVLIGMIHTHPVGGTLPSGGSYSQDDQANLSYVQDFREYQQGGSGSQGRIYIASNAHSYETVGETKIHVYDHRNRDAAIAGQEGPEVNPEAQPCP